MMYELLAENFVCPDFHTCTLVDSVKTCEDSLSPGVKGICQSVSTNFFEMIGRKCGYKGRQICYELSCVSYPGPAKVMLSVHNELTEKICKFTSENFPLIVLGGMGVLALAYGSQKLIEKIKVIHKNLETRQNQIMKNGSYQGKLNTKTSGILDSWKEILNKIMKFLIEWLNKMKNMAT